MGGLWGNRGGDWDEGNGWNPGCYPIWRKPVEKVTGILTGELNEFFWIFMKQEDTEQDCWMKRQNWELACASKQLQHTKSKKSKKKKNTVDTSMIWPYTTFITFRGWTQTTANSSKSYCNTPEDAPSIAPRQQRHSPPPSYLPLLLPVLHKTSAYTPSILNPVPLVHQVNLT